jgi:hypothetical protein
LELSFSDAQVRDLCSSQAALARTFGAEVARKICCRVAVLVAAPTLAQVPSSPPVGLRRLTNPGRFAVAIGVTHRLVFQPLTKETKTMSDLAQISRVMIVGIEANSLPSCPDAL